MSRRHLAPPRPKYIGAYLVCPEPEQHQPWWGPLPVFRALNIALVGWLLGIGTEVFFHFSAWLRTP